MKKDKKLTKKSLSFMNDIDFVGEEEKLRKQIKKPSAKPSQNTAHSARQRRLREETKAPQAATQCRNKSLPYLAEYVKDTYI